MTAAHVPAHVPAQMEAAYVPAHVTAQMKAADVSAQMKLPQPLLSANDDLERFFDVISALLDLKVKLSQHKNVIINPSFYTAATYPSTEGLVFGFM